MSAKLRVIPLGGLGEIGKNMTAIQYEDEMIIVDCGIMFPENDMLGIDLIIPDYTYVREHKEKVKAVLFTHGHEDHVGAVAHLMQDIDAPIYATPLTTGLLKNKLREAKLLNKVKINVIQAGDILNITDNFKVEPFHMAHSIPDCVGFGITTPVGLVVHTGDYKFDHTPVDGWPPDFAKLAEFSQRGVLLLMADSTNAERPGWTPSETVITEAMNDVIASAPGRVIVATFASLISRIQQVANAAYRNNRKLAVVGRSMRDNVKMARELGYLEIPDDMLIDISEAGKLPGHKVVVMATGSQGEPTSVIGRLAYDRSRHLSIEENDTIVISAHTIPGNEETVTRIINRLFQRGANVLYEGIVNVHVSGHASREEMKLLINLVRPQFLLPVHGELRHLTQHARMAYDLGIPEGNVAVIENGTIIELDQNGMSIKERLPGGYVYVDGAGVGDVTRRVLRDRERLADSGFMVVAVETNGTQLVGKPEVISRGLQNLDDSDLKGIEDAIRKVVKSHGNKAQDRLKQLLEEGVNRHLYSKTGKRPMVFLVVK